MSDTRILATGTDTAIFYFHIKVRPLAKFTNRLNLTHSYKVPDEHMDQVLEIAQELALQIQILAEPQEAPG